MLNSPLVQVYTKFKSPTPERKAGGWLYWILALAGAAFLGWIWWQYARSPEQTPAASETNAPRRSISVVSNRVTAPVSATASNRPAVLKPPETVKTNAADSTDSSHGAQNVLEFQVALARQAISPGVLDGVNGSQTRAAVVAFQQREKLPATGELDAVTKARLVLSEAALASYTVKEGDLARLQPLSRTWLGKSEQSALDYESILELVAEKGHTHPNLVRRLNPDLAWTNISAGTVVRLPNVMYPRPPAKAAVVKIHLAAKTLQIFDAAANLLAHFPCSIAQRVEKRPVGELRVMTVAPNPNYTFDPDVFPESPEARELKQKLILPPGPNNPVGVAWIGLDKPGYGIHGTPSPEQVGRTESHGCFRLANWDAEYLARLVSIGTPVVVEP